MGYIKKREYKLILTGDEIALLNTIVYIFCIDYKETLEPIKDIAEELKNKISEENSKYI
jgi:hypothetical protein